MMHHACAASLLNPSPRLPLPPDLALIRGWEWEWRPPQRPSLLQTKILLKGLTVQVWWEKAELEGRQVERGWYPALFQPEKFDTEEGTREQLLSIKYLGCGTEEDLYWDNLCGRPFGGGLSSVVRLPAQLSEGLTPYLSPAAVANRAGQLSQVFRERPSIAIIKLDVTK